jgi:hypothetical protein
MARWQPLRREGHLELALRLDPVEPEPDTLDEELEHLRLVPNLLLLARIDHEREYELCRSIAQHLLGRDPEPPSARRGPP